MAEAVWLRRQPVYVETVIRTDMERLWFCTQRPEQHEQWDLRFSSITYLPKEEDDPRQRFRYTTRIGFGLRISGCGATKGGIAGRGGERKSVLEFWSDQPLSLIRRGSGYWKYTPVPGGIRFVTKYRYETRFGLAGKLFDKLVFRPLIGWATAWSFDCLRIWLEYGIAPAVSVRNSLRFCVSVLSIGLFVGFQLGALLFKPELLNGIVVPAALNAALGGCFFAAWKSGRRRPRAANCLRSDSGAVTAARLRYEGGDR
ncbi:hypothetical protein ABEV74_04905 [Paenibacillus cisolokensis]|jgi:hypothetical protein|uniref:hypothetical protein n=1 Tax=Paenibacillus cisolokensis TaxID=1658519 RepID=UPI003D275CDD